MSYVISFATPQLIYAQFGAGLQGEGVAEMRTAHAGGGPACAVKGWRPCLLLGVEDVRVAVVDLEREGVDGGRVDAATFEAPAVHLGVPGAVAAAVLAG